MTVALYMDHQVPRAITAALRARGVDVLTAFEDAHHEVDDHTLLERATELTRVLFTRDDDLLAIAAELHRQALPFAGVLYAHQLRVSIGACIRDLELIAQSTDPEELANQVLFLPL